MLRLILFGVATSLATPAMTDESNSAAMLREVLAFCDQVVREPKTARIGPDDADSYPFSTADGAKMTNSFNWDLGDGAVRSAWFRRDVLPGGIISSCHQSHRYWEDPDHPYEDLVDEINEAARKIIGPDATRKGGQSADSLLRSERYVWAGKAFPPSIWIEAVVQNDSASITINRADDVGG